MKTLCLSLVFIVALTASASAQTFEQSHARSLILAGNGTDVTHTLTLQAPALASGYTLTFPNSSATGVLTNTAGVLTWVNLSTAILNPMTSPGDMIYGGLLGAATRLAATATANQILLSGANGAPSWSTATYPATSGAAANYLRSNGTNFVSSAILPADLSGAGVEYGPASTQNTVAAGATKLYDIAYAVASGANATDAGAAITANASGATNGTASGLTIAATGSGTGTTTGLSVSATGAGTNDAIVTTGDIQVQEANLTTNSVQGLMLTNTTASTAGVPNQNSPSLHFKSNVWNTTTPANNTFEGWQTFMPTSGATPSARFRWQTSNNGAGLVDQMSLIDAGVLIVATGFRISNTAASGTILRGDGTNFIASTVTYPATTTASSLLYSNGANVVAALPTANNGVLATNSSGVPSITATPTLGVAGASTGSLAFANTTGANLTTIQAGVSAPAVTYTLPASTPVTGQVLTLGTVVGSGPYTAPLTWATPTTGTVTAVSVASANGFAGASSGGATPALTLSTTITGMLKGNATAISAATLGTDYSAGTNGLATGILKSTTGTGALTIAVAGDFPTLNQNTTGTANIAGGTVGAIPYQSAANTTTVLGATATANKILLSGASAAPVWSTPTFPNASATARKIIVSDGTNWTASTETWAVPGANTHLLQSDGTNWTSVAIPTWNQNTTGTANIAGGTVGAIPYQSAANTTTILGATATANQILLSGANAAPAWSTATYPVTSGAAANYLRSNGTNFVSSAIQPADLSGAGVEYGPASTQNSLAIAAAPNYLYDISYAATASTHAALGAQITSTNTATAGTAAQRSATALTLNATATATGTATGLLITTAGGAADPQIQLAGTTSGIVTSALADVYYEETGDTYGTSRLHMQNRNGSNGALFEMIPNAGNLGTDLVDFGFKPGAQVQSNIRLEARPGTLRASGNTSATIPEEFQMFFGTTTTPEYVFEVGEAATLLEVGNFGIGYSANVNTSPVALPLEKLDVHGSASTASNIILSNTGVAGTNGLPGTLKFQGTRDGISSFTAGAQASNTYNYTLPITTPTANQVLSATAVSGATPFAVTLGWANALTNPMTTTGDILYSSSNTGTPARLGIGTTAQFLGVAGGLPSWTSTLTTASAIGTTSTDGLVLTNTNAAANNAQQFSSRLRLTGQGWETTTPASQAVDWIMENQPVQGVANPSTNLVISSRINGGAFSNNATLTSGGQLLINGAGAVTNAVLSVKDGHIQSSTSAIPTIAVGSGLGAGGSVGISNATDVAGKITVTTGSSGVTGLCAVVTVNKTYSAGTMIVIVQAADQPTAVVDPWGSQASANTFDVGIASGFPINTTLNFYYHIIQTQ